MAVDRSSILEEMEWDESIREIIARFMEPDPDRVTARHLRKDRPRWNLYSIYDVPSRLGWWETNIGTDNEDDDKLVEWAPRDFIDDADMLLKVLFEIKKKGFSRDYIATLLGVIGLELEDIPWTLVNFDIVFRCLMSTTKQKYHAAALTISGMGNTGADNS